jgi:riboflavin kinase/FMN adenylyltransferase
MAAHRVDWQQPLPAECRGGAITIGNFDGVHRGHAALLSATNTQARQVDGPAVAVTFDPHPLTLLRPTLVVPPLLTLDDRIHWLHQRGADQVVLLHTTADLLALSAADFFCRVIQQGFEARAIVEGANFGFGHGREGNVETLGRLSQAAGLRLTVVGQVVLEGTEVSSSVIRAALLKGDVAEAARLLGRAYRLRGTVGTGQRRGQALGFPTANLERLETLCPHDGVYAVRALVQERSWPAAAHIGPNPTFGEDARKVEVHLIGFEGDLYGQDLAIDFVERLRDIRSFADRAELIAQIKQDVERARACLE